MNLFEYAETNSHDPCSSPGSSQQPLNEVPDIFWHLTNFMALHCHGEKNAMHARELAKAIGLKTCNADRKVRQLISNYKRHFPFMVTANSAGGFFITDNPEHLAAWERTQFATIASIYANIHEHRILASKMGFERHGNRNQVRYERR